MHSCILSTQLQLNVKGFYADLQQKYYNLASVALAAVYFPSMTLAEKIQAVASAKGLNLRELAKQIGISYSTLRSYTAIGSRRSPSVVAGVQMAKALGVSIEWLFDENCGLPIVPYCPPPDVPIYPWPPDGISWEEVRFAIAHYIVDMYMRHELQASAQARAYVPRHEKVLKVLQGFEDMKTEAGRRKHRK